MVNQKAHKTKSIAAFLRGFRYAFDGIRNLFVSQRNAKVHLLAAIAVIVGGLYFSISVYEWIAVILCIVLVLAAEAFNTAIEKLVDEISPEIKPSAGKIKDLAAGAVFLTAIGAALIGIIIFWPKIFS